MEAKVHKGYQHDNRVSPNMVYKAVRHVLGSKDFIISFKGPAGAGKTE